MKKNLLPLATVSASISAAQAQIAYYDIPDVTLGIGQHLYFDFDGGISSSSYIDGATDFYFNRLSTENTYLFNYTPWSTAAAFTTSNFTPFRYALGANLDFTSTSVLGFLEHNGNGPWNGDTGSQTAYIALRNSLTQQEAWIGLRYNDAANTLVIESFAVAPGSANMTAGQTTSVPEPADAGYLMALLAGGAAVYQRRRQIVTPKAENT